MLRTALALACLLLCGHSLAADKCHSVVLTAELAAGESFSKAIGQDLVFRVTPTKLGPKGDINGWEIALTPSQYPERDYIYWVTPPLRQNGVQILGPSYGEDTKSSLGRPHEMRFLLSATDYDRISPLVENALWPYSAPDPDKAADEYLRALEATPTGRLLVTVLDYDGDSQTGSIHRIKLSAEFTVPATFSFDTALKPKSAPCPPAAE